MNSSLYDYSIPSVVYAILAVISLIMGIALIRKKNIPGTQPLMGLYFALFIWSAAYIFEAGALRYEQKLFWSQIAYIGTLGTPVWLLAFAQEFTNRKFVNRPVYWFLVCLIPATTLLLAFTNEHHHWIWTQIEISGSNHLAIYHHGPWFWVFFTYSYILIGISLLFFVLSAFRQYRVFRSQSVLTIMASITVIIGNILYIIPENPVPGMEWTLVGFIITSVILAIGILRYRLFDLVPAARGALVEIMNEGVLLVDEGGRIIDANPSFLKLIQADPVDQILGMPAKEVLQTVPSILQVLSRPKFSGPFLRTEIVIGKKVLDLTLTELQQKDKKLKGRLLVINDISSLKNTENTLHETNQILSQENMKSQKLIDELDAYAHTVAHDLKTPLNGIAGFSELLVGEIENGDYEQARNLSLYINEAAFKMVHIIDGLLLLSSVRSEEVEKSVLDMRAIFESAIKRIQSQIDQSKARFNSLHFGAPVLGYAPWIEEVLVNYISNAIKYGGEPPEITIASREEEGLVWICVEDNGPGIPEGKQDKLFVAYSRLSPHKAEGHGLGLSIVKRILDKLGGAVKAERIPNGGSRFSFGLPPHEA